MGNTITISELAKAAKLDRRTLLNYVARGMPCEQVGRKAAERGTTSIPYLFDRADALAWIAEYQAEVEARQASPYIEKLTQEDPRFEAAVTARQRAEAQVQEILGTYVARVQIAEVTRDQFESLRDHLLKIPRSLARTLAAMTGKPASLIESILREEITSASSGLRVDSIFAESAPLRPALPEPSCLDEIDELDEDIPTAKRYAPSDPRFQLVKARTARSQLEIAIERGVLLPVDEVATTLGTIFGELNSMLRAVGGSVAQRIASDRAAVAREVKDKIDRATFDTYEKIEQLAELDFDDGELGDEL